MNVPMPLPRDEEGREGKKKSKKEGGEKDTPSFSSVDFASALGEKGGEKKRNKKKSRSFCVGRKRETEKEGERAS